MIFHQFSGIPFFFFNILTLLKLGCILEGKMFYYLIGSISPHKWHLRVDETWYIKLIAKIDTLFLCSQVLNLNS